MEEVGYQMDPYRGHDRLRILRHHGNGGWGICYARFLDLIGDTFFGCKPPLAGLAFRTKFATYHKLYIFLLAFCLIPAMILLPATRVWSLPYDMQALQKVLTGAALFVVIPALVLIGSDPLNRWGNRNPDRLIGAGLGFIGAILGLVLEFVLVESVAIGEILAILFTIVSLASAVLLFLPFFLSGKSATA